jgi:hypothetical protein
MGDPPFFFYSITAKQKYQSQEVFYILDRKADASYNISRKGIGYENCKDHRLAAERLSGSDGAL